MLLKNHQYPQALAAFAAALTLQPENVPALFGLAQALTEAGSDRLRSGDDAFRDMLARAPDYVDPVVDFAALLNDMGRTDEALVLVRDALVRHPEHANLHTMLFVCLFIGGDWPAAWPSYEWRLKDPEVSKHLLPTDRPRWQGEDLAGKTILLQYEQGFGDILQFVRYAPMVKARGGRVVLRAPQPLMSLMRTVAGVDDIIDNETKAPAFDLHAPLMSLAADLRHAKRHSSCDRSYIAPDPDLVLQWRERLGAHSGISVGLVWQRQSGASQRPAPLDAAGSVAAVARPVRAPVLVSLQIGYGQQQAQGLEGRIIDPAAEIDTTSFARCGWDHRQPRSCDHDRQCDRAPRRRQGQTGLDPARGLQ